VRFEPDIESSVLSEAIRSRLEEWKVSDLALEASVDAVPSTYGLSGPQPDGYAHLEAVIVLQRAHVLTFLKLTAGVFAAALIALLTLFMDPRNGGAFGSRLGVLTGVLFGVLLSMRAADAFIGDATRLTLVSNIHLVGLALIVVIASASLIERRRIERGHRVRYPDWPLIVPTAAFYVLINLALVAHAGWL
jgi:hypothetical protein